MLETALFIATMLVLYVLLFSRFGLFRHMIRVRQERRRRMSESRPDFNEHVHHEK